MAWIKRNLYFLIGSLVALALMVVGIFLLFSQLSEENKVAEDIAKQYAELKRLSQANPNPGGGTIDNIKAAKEQDAALHALIAKITPYYQRIAPIPDYGTNKISNSDFAAELRNTVSQLHRSATEQSVILPNDYYFTFESQKKLMIFDPISLDRLATHLGEIKAICDLIFDARINSLDSIHREVISTNDSNPPDYFSLKTVVSPLAEITPYEISFKCFSSQLATVMGNLANSPYGLVVKTINVEPAAGAGPEEAGASGGNSGNPNQAAELRAVELERLRAARGGLPTAVTPAATAAANRNSTIFLNEKPLRVTLLIHVVKLKSVK